MKETALSLYEQAMIAMTSGDHVGCIQRMTSSLLLDPKNEQAWNIRAAMLLKLGHPFDAVINYDRAIELRPDIGEFYVNRGAAFCDLQAYHKAQENYDKAIMLKPNFAMAYMNKANIHMLEKRTETARDLYREAVKRDENLTDAHLGLAFSLLELGEYEEGWKEYDWRWKSNQMVPRGLNVPEWNGEPAEKSTDVLVFYAEQGFGDALQFIRYAPLVKQKWGGKVFIEVRFPMMRLAKTIKGIDGVIAFGDQMPINMTKCLPMMAAPKVLGTTLETIPSHVPYLHPEATRVKMWKERLKKLPPGLKIGICWAGSARPHAPVANAVDKKRSTTIQEFKPLCLSGISFVSLQVGPNSQDVHNCPAGMTIGDWTDEIDDFHDTAALIQNLDLVISVDTSTVHIAGALGIPVWMLSRYDNCWRWLGKRSDSPWYPSLRQFVQSSAGDWFGLMQEVKRELQQFCISERKVA